MKALLIATIFSVLGLNQNAFAQAASGADAATPKTRTEVKSETRAAAKSGQLKHPEDGALYGVTDGKAVREKTRAMDRKSKADEASARRTPGRQAASAPP